MLPPAGPVAKSDPGPPPADADSDDFPEPHDTLADRRRFAAQSARAERSSWPESEASQ
jgi:hypothetical protein